MTAEILNTASMPVLQLKSVHISYLVLYFIYVIGSAKKTGHVKNLNIKIVF